MSEISELIQTLERIDAEMSPAPWCVDAVSAAIRHVQKNTEVMEDALEYADDPSGSLPSRYDGESLGRLRNLLPEIIAHLKAGPPPKGEEPASP